MNIRLCCKEFEGIFRKWIGPPLPGQIAEVLLAQNGMNFNNEYS